ncbi:MAG: redoxin domain-containing protein [Bryobacterales bacterium]|nr:redoxin domain-containing protein [Bryobacterales bacterium]
MDQNIETLRKQGLGLAAISYDSVAILKHFSDRRKIRFPLLSDAGSGLIRRLGILNAAGKEGTPFYGIPHPVTFVLDANGTIRHKYFEEDFRERPTLAGILSKELGVNPAAAASHPKAKHVAITTAASTGIVSGGQRILLSVEIDIPKDYHLYAPGVEGYYAVDWQMGASDLVKPHKVEYPKSRILYLQAIDEKVPVFEGKIRLLRDVTLAQGKVLTAAAGEGKQVTLSGSVKYQACSDRMCFPPETVPLEWTLRFDPHDVVRVPRELQRK